MRDGKPSRLGSVHNLPIRLPARWPTPYGLAITIGLSAALWAIIIGIAVLLF
jgi:hypothetical protein